MIIVDGRSERGDSLHSNLVVAVDATVGVLDLVSRVDAVLEPLSQDSSTQVWAPLTEGLADEQGSWRRLLAARALQEDPRGPDAVDETLARVNSGERGELLRELLSLPALSGEVMVDADQVLMSQWTPSFFEYWQFGGMAATLLTLRDDVNPSNIALTHSPFVEHPVSHDEGALGAARVGSLPTLAHYEQDRRDIPGVLAEPVGDPSRRVALAARIGDVDPARLLDAMPSLVDLDGQWRSGLTFAGGTSADDLVFDGYDGYVARTRTGGEAYSAWLTEWWMSNQATSPQLWVVSVDVRE